MKYEEHETLYETEQERNALRKPIRDDFMPLATSPEIQKETMIKLGMDPRSEEERLMEELRLERGEEEKKGPTVLRIQEDNGIVPQVDIVIPQRKTYAPKQNT